MNRDERRDVVVLALTALVLFFWRLGSHDLWPPDEPRFALVAREMWERGDPVVLHYGDQIYTNKPPLYIWAVNGFALVLGGVGEWAVRLPSAVAAFLSLLLVHRLGTWMYDRWTGLWGSLVFATGLQIMTRARWGSTDMTLGLFVLAAIVLFWRGSVVPAQRARLFVLAWVSMALATLAKGPVGLLLPLIVAVPPVLLACDRDTLRRMFPAAGIALFLAIVGAWFGVFAWRVGPAVAFGDVLWHRSVDHYLDAANVRHPGWFYLWRFPAGFFPWIVFLPWALWHVFAEPERGHRASSVFLTWWWASILVFFSLSSGKRGVYVIPAYPAAALLVGQLFASGGRRLRAPLWLWLAVAALLVAALPFAAARRAEDLVPIGAALGGVFLLGAAVAAHQANRGRHVLAAGALVASVVAAHLVAIEGLIPWVNRHEGVRAFAETVRRHHPPGATFATTEQKRGAWVFYTGLSSPALDDPESVLAYLRESGPRSLLLEERELRELRGRLPDDVREVLRGRVGTDDYVLLRRDGAGGSGP